MKEIVKFLADHPSMRVVGRGTGIMADTIKVVRRDGRNRWDRDVVFFVRPTWVTAGPVGRLP